ncbi:hypothetical protein M1397_03275 [Candidatus Marsarchaeota archaeon]|jgi:hypothetical protein|nr:hypothetical protein [Candidatus Marsarchaeota archaeon]
MGQKNSCKNREYVQLNYHDSLVYPLKKRDGSSQNIKIHLNWLSFLAPNPPQAPISHPKNLSVKAIVFTDKNLQ